MLVYFLEFSFDYAISSMSMFCEELLSFDLLKEREESISD